MASLVVYFILFKFVAGNENFRSDSILHHLNSGIKFAKEFLGSESVALKVADFVVRAFQPSTSTKLKHPSHNYQDDSKENYEEYIKPTYNINEVPYSESPLRHLVRLLGLQPNQISAVAVNALIFVAQMITTFLAGPKRLNRPYRSEDFTKWILNKQSRKLQDLLEVARNDTLPEQIEEIIKEQSEEETTCIQLLVCKITPFINKMQETVFNQKEDKVPNREFRGAAFMYQHLPTIEEIHSKGDVCERKYKNCKLYE